MHEFKAEIEIIGINPFVYVPQEILQAIFLMAGKNTSPIAIRGFINEVAFSQTLVRYAGDWRLYINMKMLKDSPKRIGEVINIRVEYDASDRTLLLHPKLKEAFDKDTVASAAFALLPPSRRHEINRYIIHLKSESKIEENVKKAIDHLHGNEKFAGR